MAGIVEVWSFGPSERRPRVIVGHRESFLPASVAFGRQRLLGFWSFHGLECVRPVIDMRSDAIFLCTVNRSACLNATEHTFKPTEDRTSQTKLGQTTVATYCSLQ